VRSSESDFHSFNWSLSPDGKLLTFSKKFGTQGQPAIRLFSLVDAKKRRISLPGWAGIATLDWSADGKSLWSTAFTTSETMSGLWTTGFNATGESTLLKVELSQANILHEIEEYFIQDVLRVIPLIEHSFNPIFFPFKPKSDRAFIGLSP
jgi:hypothetical protein